MHVAVQRVAPDDIASSVAVEIAECFDAPLRRDVRMHGRRASARRAVHEPTCHGARGVAPHDVGFRIAVEIADRANAPRKRDILVDPRKGALRTNRKAIEQPHPRRTRRRAPENVAQSVAVKVAQTLRDQTARVSERTNGETHRPIHQPRLHSSSRRVAQDDVAARVARNVADTDDGPVRTKRP